MLTTKNLQPERIRVLVLTPMYPNSMDISAGIFIHNQVRYLVENGCSVGVVSPIPYSPKFLWFFVRWKSYGLIQKFETKDGISVCRPRYFRSPGKWFRGMQAYFMHLGIKRIMRSLIQQFKPHVLHVHTATPLGYVGHLLGKKHNIPVICSLRGTEINDFATFGKLSKHLTKKVIAGVDQVTSVSKTLRNVAEAITSPRKPIRVLYNGCDLLRFAFNKEERNRLRNSLQLSQKDKLLLFLGNFLKTKGVIELLSAFVRLAPRYPNSQLLFIGGGPEKQKLRSVISENRLNERVRLIPRSITQLEVARYLSAADVLVLPTYAEGLPNVVLEAMACGLPVVASKVGGIPEAVADGKTGILVPKKNVKALMQAIECLLKDEALAKRMGHAGQDLVKSKFSWQENARQTIEIYRHEILDSLPNSGNADAREPEKNAPNEFIKAEE